MVHPLYTCKCLIDGVVKNDKLFLSLINYINLPILLAIPNLYMMETVHSVKTAETLQSLLLKLDRKDKLKVMIQVNTSDEDSKSKKMYIDRI